MKYKTLNNYNNEQSKYKYIPKVRGRKQATQLQILKNFDMSSENSNITQTCTIDSVIVRCAECGYEIKADKNIKYGDIGKPPKIAALGKISNCPECSELYGYIWLKWYDSEGNAL